MTYKISLRNACVSIEAPAAIKNYIQQTVFSSIIRKSLKPEAIHYKITEQDNRYTLFKNNQEIHYQNRLAEILYNLEWQVVDDLIRLNNRLLQFHAASLVQANQGMLFLGAGGSGKTSLSILLMREGFRFLSDEVGLLDPIRMELYPFPRNLIVKEHLFPYINHFSDLKTLLVDKPDLGQVAAKFINPTCFGKLEACNKAGLKAIFYLSKNDNGTSFQPIGEQHAFNKLMPLLFNPNQFKNNLLSVMGKIIQQIPCYELKLSHPLALSAPQTHYLIAKLNEIMRKI